MMNSRYTLVAGLALVFSFSALAQDSSPSSGGWRKFQPSAPSAPAPQASQSYDENQAPQREPARPQAQAPSGPTSVTIPAGTWITVRVNEPLSSDHNQPGDYFMATLAQPIVVNGLTVARRGQTVSGVVSEAKKAGRASGTSRLGLELTEIGVADGRQVQVKTRMMERRGETSYGRDAAGIGATVATGAAIGAAVNGGVGAGVGAAAGVVASTIGVLLTRGRATEVYPESALTFRLESPVTVDATYEAFEPARQQDYDQRPPQRPPQRMYAPAPYYGYGYGPGFGYGYGYYPYSYYYGPSFFFSYHGHRGGRRW
jgi:hypothetical protein